ncbi:MAG: hypothetical protein GF418_09495 [Chitinivibrionales bacterium]|nr:hypothetical protein [Chitinivibrionales bacterium]MBD3395843.1 hypothetical protein [Chitinivibrionales bacterium]
MSRTRHPRLRSRPSGIFMQLWEAFWHPPDMHCPKCRGTTVEYYDPFFFSPLRTLAGRRRLRCTSCRFIWRPSRSGKSVWDHLRQRYYP